MLLKVASTTHENTLIDFTTYFSLSNQVPQPEQSNIIFFKVLDQRCDDKETLLNVINDMFVEFVQSGKKKNLFYWRVTKPHTKGFSPLRHYMEMTYPGWFLFQETGIFSKIIKRFY